MDFWKIISLLLKLYGDIKFILEAEKKRDAEAWEKKIIEGVRAYAKLQSASTPEERASAEEDLARNWLNK